MQLPIFPAPRAFVPTAGTVRPAALPLHEELASLTARGTVAEESYELELTPQGGRLRATTEQGLRWGRQTWRSLVDSGLEVPAGLVLEVWRHFYPVAEVKAVLDRLAALKFNRFHWHLVDDQGWRLEIPGYPRFTEVGAWRTKDGVTTGGFYTAAEVAEVVAYASERGIVVVPEIELPGHCLAALASYPELSCSGEPEAVPTRWGILDGVYCASSEPAARILEDVLREVARLFPGPWIHIGGDEVVHTRWERCPRCQDKIRREGLDGTKGLEAAFFRRFLAFVESLGKTPLGWNELFEHTIPASVPVQWWHRPDLAQKTLRQGNPLLVSNVEYCYFDYPYTADDSWYISTFMKITPVEKVYANPVVPDGCEAWLEGIWGGEACVWTEQVPPSQFENRVRGRLEALAEVYWTFDARPGWSDFQRRAHLRGVFTSRT